MLIQKPRNFPCVMVFKLSSGEEIIANASEEKTSEFIIEKPLQMAMGQQGPQFAPFMMMGDMEKPVPLNKNLVIAYVDASDSVAQQYLSITSNIALPKKQSIIV